MKKLLYPVICLFILVACSKTENNTTNQESLAFNYNGVSYSSTYDLGPDSILNIHNSDVNTLYQKLMDNPELTTVENEKGEVEFYDSYEDYLKERGLDVSLKKLPDLSQMYNFLTANFFVYKDYEGEYFNLNTGRNVCELLERTPYKSLASMGLYCDFNGLKRLFPYTTECHVIISTECKGGGYTRVFKLTPKNPSHELRYFRDIHYQVNLLTWKKWKDMVKHVGVRFY